MLALADIRLLIDYMNGSANVLDGYLTPQQLARQLGVTTRTLLRWEVQRIRWCLR